MLDKVIIIQNGDYIQYPVIEEGIVWETYRKGMPGKLTFSVLKDPSLNFEEGNAVSFKVGDSNIFYGFVFGKKRSKDKTIQVTAYDQLRYFKNKDTYVYTNKKASDLIRKIGADFNLNLGTIEDTEYIIASQVDDNKTLFDISQEALDITLQNKKKMFVLYDDFGALTLKNIESMKLNLLIDEESGENFDYYSSIDGETYNRIKLSYENDSTKKREIYIAQDTSNINNWGVLQYFDTIDEKTNGKAKADALLALYNKKSRSLTISNVAGDIRVRGGSVIGIMMDLGDVVVQNYMVVESVKHTFNNDEHLMNLSLRGGEFLA